MKVPKSIDEPMNQAIGADADVAKFQRSKKKNYLEQSPALSQANTKFDSIATRQVAVLMGDDFSMTDFKKMTDALKKQGAMIKVVAPHGGTIKSDDGKEQKVDASIVTAESVLYDALYVPWRKGVYQCIKRKCKIYQVY